jgi:hypothetical protein
MALPVPVLKNWYDQFGSQNVPTEAGGGAASYVAPPTITSATLSAGGVCTVVATRAGAGKVDWGDGSALGTMAASGNLIHTYTRLGDFAITIYTDAAPDAKTVKRFRVNTLA